jgi:hypothetical protein
MSGNEPCQTIESSPQGWADTIPRRIFSLAEFLVGSVIVIGHNIYHVIPNEVPILFALGLVSLWLRNGGWGAMGLRWPVSLAQYDLDCPSRGGNETAARPVGY